MPTSQCLAAVPTAHPATLDWHTLSLTEQDSEAAKLLVALAFDPQIAPSDSRRQQVLIHAVAAIGVRLQQGPAVGMVALAQRVARLNAEAGVIGAGMLASLVTDARRLVASGAAA